MLNESIIYLALFSERDSLKAVLEALLQKPTSDGETRQMSLQEMPLKKTALQTTVSYGDDSFEGDLNPSDPSSSNRRPTSTSPLNSTILKHQRQGEELVHRWGGEDREALLYPRSDDQGPLEAVVQQMAQQLTQVTADVQALQNANQVLQTRGSTYTRWGSSSCPHSEDVVYSGVVGGSYYTHTGAAANTLCLSMSPVLRDLPHGHAITQLYGGEYETYDSTHQDRDPSCAVCRSRLSTTIMIPGTDVCSAGWTMEYNGYLMAGYYGHNAATEFVCVDSAMEARAGSDDGHDGHLFYFTKTVCGSLPCPPYEADRVVACAVCSKWIVCRLLLDDFLEQWLWVKSN